MLLATVATMSMVSYALAATPMGQTSISHTVSATSATGTGWIISSGHRDDFSFYATRGTLKVDGWRYSPNAQVSYTGRDLGKANGLIQVWSTRVWRFKVEKIDGGYRVIVAGVATVKIGQNLRSNWWFRVTARDITDGTKGKDGFMIQLWRPIGAGNSGGWSPKDFNASKPATLHLNATAFYQSQGPLRGGNIAIKP
jgi:hypothetical protein